MNTIDDLRATLEQEADHDDTGRWARPVAVRERVRVIRRRRATAAALAAAMVLVASAVAVRPLVHGTASLEPAGEVAGVDVPQQISVYGFPYRIVGVHDGADRARLDDGDTDRAVTLAASGLGDGVATMYVDGQPVARVRGDAGAATPYPIANGSPSVRIVLDGTPDGARAGYAVYDATGDLAAGVGNGTAVFRDQLAGQALLTAGFSDRQHPSLDLHARGSMDTLRLAFFCTATDDNLWVQVTVDGHPGSGSSCGGSGPDAAQGTSTTTDRRAPVRDHTFHVTLTRGADGPAVTPDGVVFGLGVYARSATADRLLGTRIDRTTEWGGRTWVLDRVLGRSATVDTSDGDRLLGLVARGTRAHATWQGQLLHGTTATMAGGRGASSMVDGLLLAGDRYTVRAHGNARLLVYRPE